MNATFSKKENIIGKGIFEVFPDNPNDKKATGVLNLKASLDRVIASKTVDVISSQRYDIKDSLGQFQERYWRMNNSPILDSKGEITCITHSVFDITELTLLKKSNEQVEAEVFSRGLLLEEINQYLQSILDTAYHAFISIDSEGRVTFWNSHAEEMFGWKQSEVMGKTLTSTIIPEKFHQAHINGLKHFLLTNEGTVLGKRLEISARHKEGKVFPVELTINVLKHRDKFSFFAFLQDISERKEAQKKLSQMNAELEMKVLERTAELEKSRQISDEASRIKSVFLANMSHEIRTPLGVVMGYSELLGNPEISQTERKSFIAAIRRNGELLSNIINDVLDLSKVEAGKLAIRHSEVLISEVLDDMSSLLNMKAKAKGVKLLISYDSNIPKIIRTDPFRLRQILLNIVGNAIKFTNQGSINIYLKLSDDPDKDVKLIFEVQDEGCGISPKNIKNLFQPFSQIDNSTKRKYGGTGLGLVLSKHLAHLLGGDVILKESEVGKGSVFIISVDPGPIQSLNATSRGGRTQPKNKATLQEERLDGVNILLAEDCPDNQFLIRNFLTQVGAVVDVVDNGLKAVEISEKKKYDIVLMDIQMPIMDGYESVARLRELGFCSPIIALTAHALKGEREHCLSIGFDDHVTKPINGKTLVSNIAKTLKSSRGFSNTLIMVMLAIVISLAMVALLTQPNKPKYLFNVHNSMSVIKQNIYLHIDSSEGWNNTLADTTNTSLTCIKDHSDCSAFNGLKTPLVAVRDLVNNAVLSNLDSATQGISLDGNACNFYNATSGNIKCPIKVSVTWKPDCTGSPCIDPIYIIEVIFSYSGPRDAGPPPNLSKYNFTLTKP